MNPYTEEYYKTANYADYSEREERYYKLAKETTNLLESLSLINEGSFITDFGCATGHLLTGLKKSGYHDVDGVEISDWAREECKKKNLTVFSSLSNWKEESLFESDIVYTLDVLEHMTDEEVVKFLEETKSSKLIIRIPVASEKDGNFHLDVSRKDPTHINCKTKWQWRTLIKNIRYPNTRILHLNLNTIYDSKGVFSALIL
jgi:hypothetical protein